MRIILALVAFGVMGFLAFRTISKNAPSTTGTEPKASERPLSAAKDAAKRIEADEQKRLDDALKKTAE
jgi:hypothetical protein